MKKIAYAENELNKGYYIKNPDNNEPFTGYLFKTKTDAKAWYKQTQNIEMGE